MQMTKKITAILLLSLSLAGCVTTQCLQQCSEKGYPDERCDSLCADHLDGNQASYAPWMRGSRAASTRVGWVERSDTHQ